MRKNARHCLYCDDALLERYRSDCKFCPEKYGIQNYCKNAHHNLNTLARYHITKDILKKFYICREILKTFLGDSESREISEQQLIDAGWSFNYGVSATLKDTGNIGYLFGKYVAEDLDNGVFKIFKYA